MKRRRPSEETGPSPQVRGTVEPNRPTTLSEVYQADHDLEHIYIILGRVADRIDAAIEAQRREEEQG